MRKKPTLQDIAKAINVSTASVSNALHGRGRISTQKKEKILQEAEKLGYFKNKIRYGKPEKLVGLLLHTTYPYLWQYFNTIIKEIDRILTQKRICLLIIPVDFNFDSSVVESKIAAADLDGLFSLHCVDKDLFQKLEDSGMPVILLNNGDYQNQFFTVTFDDLAASYEATNYLMSLGHTNFAYIDYTSKDLFSIRRDRYYGFKKALEEAELCFDEAFKISLDYENLNSITPIIRKLFEKDNRPTAVFAHDDYLAAHILPALDSIGIHVPKDLSIIGSGDLLDYNNPFLPKITTMKINTNLLGKIAGELMLSRFETQPTDIQVIKVREQLMIRETCSERKSHNTQPK